MKIRLGFVSNSSSSSFICDVTGRDYTEYEASLEDAQMYECENGHYFDEKFYVEATEEVGEEIDYAKNDLENIIKVATDVSFEAALSIFRTVCQYGKSADKELKALLYENFQNGFDAALVVFRSITDYEEEDTGRYETKARHCPICQMTELDRDRLTMYLLTKVGMTRKEVAAEVKATYGTLEAFEASQKGQKLFN